MTVQGWLRYVGLPVVAVTTVVLVTLQLHRDLQAHEAEQVARIAELESYAARSRLVQDINALLDALHDARAYWTEYGDLPRDQWASADNIELDHFRGIDVILWAGADQSNHYAFTPEKPALDYRPGDDEWAGHRDLLETARGLDDDAMLGPFRDDAGRSYLEIYFLPARPGEHGILIARVHTQPLLAHLLQDDSPGYAITVKWRGEVIHARGEAAPGLPAQWVRSGRIRNELGVVWEVTHAPNPALLATLDSPSINMSRNAGLLIAVLIGLLLIESARAERKAARASAAEAEMARLNVGLEAQVRKRTREVAMRSQDLITITDSVGHDLRNPLNSVSTNLQLLHQQYRDQLDADGQAILAQTQTSLDSMTEILDRLLEMSAVFSQRFRRERIDMEALARTTFEELHAADPDPPARLILRDLDPAWGEPIQVETLVLNLLSNALKYSRERARRRIEMTSRRAGDEVVYAVSDNGVGFDERAADRLFRAYERLDEAQEGLGLGLDIAARVVERHGGRIWAEGRPGKGATFYFTLGPEGHDD